MRIPSISFLPAQAILIASAIAMFLLYMENASAEKTGECESFSKDFADRVRTRDIGISPGIFSPGPLNAITDVNGVLVGHFTLKKGRSIRTGATTVLPHGGNIYKDRVPAGLHVANGFGKLAGVTQIEELGEIETPIVLTNTLAVVEGIAAILQWTLDQPGNEKAISINAVVGETNDAKLNDIQSRVLTVDQIRSSIDGAHGGPIEEGAVGAGTGTISFGWKGGIGTSSRQLPEHLDGFTVGVLVQSNFGGVLVIDGQRVGEQLDQYFLKDESSYESADGSIMIIIATDAPLSDRNLRRLARRSSAGLARTGASFPNGSGDYAIAFSTAADVRRTEKNRSQLTAYPELSNDQMSPLFQAVAEATEEAIYNSLFMAEPMRSFNKQSQTDLAIEKFPLSSLKLRCE